MPVWIDAGLIGLAIAVALPAWTLVLELVLAFLPRSRRNESVGPLPETVVLIPAHNEAAGIAKTLLPLAAQCEPNLRLLVVADNCIDDTARIATDCGAEVIERNNPADRGKGFALDFGLRHLAARPPAVVIVLDADCTVAAGGLQRLSRRAAQAGRPVQAKYLMDPPAGAGPAQRVSAFAVLVKNVCRPSGLAVLGVASPLTGAGMAFPWAHLRDSCLASSSIVEDMKLGVDLVRAGRPALYEPDVVVRSVLPNGDAGQREQRRRWGHGHVGMMAREALPLLLHGFRTRNWRTLVFALDLLVPPLSFLLGLMVGTAIMFALLGLLGATMAPARIILASLGTVCAGLLLTWLHAGRTILPAADLLSVPRYAVSKLGLYAGYFWNRQTKWVRTDRD